MRCKNLLRETKGMALTAVIIVFLVISIISASAVAMVYSDTMFSKDDENGKKAYYAARSAIATVERAMYEEVDALSAEFTTISNALLDDLQQLNEDYLDATLTLLEGESLEDAYDRVKDEIIVSFTNNQIVAYTSNYNDLRANVLPSVANPYTHTVTLDGFDTESNQFDVVVEARPNNLDEDIIDGFHLTTTATVRGKTAKVSKWLAIEITPDANLSVQTYDLDPPGLGLFDAAIYSYGSLAFGTGGGSATSEVTAGGIYYEVHPTEPVPGDYDKTSEYNKAYKEYLARVESLLNVDGSTPTLHSKTDVADILKPYEFINQMTGNAYELTDTKRMVSKGSSIPTTITSDHSGFYNIGGSSLLEGIYNVDTSGGSVVLQINTLAFSNKGFQFNVTGGGDFILYVLDENPDGPAGGTDVNINNDHPFVTSGGSDAYLVIGQASTDLSSNENIYNLVIGKNSTVMDVYVYAPFAKLVFNNNFTLTGSIISGDFEVKNKGSVTYVPEGEGDEGEDPPPTLINATLDLPGCDTVTPNISRDYWLKRNM